MRNYANVYFRAMCGNGILPVGDTFQTTAWLRQTVPPEREQAGVQEDAALRGAVLC